MWVSTKCHALTDERRQLIAQTLARTRRHHHWTSRAISHLNTLCKHETSHTEHVAASQGCVNYGQLMIAKAKSQSEARKGE